MTWKPIEGAPRDGTPVMVAKESSTTPRHFPYPLTGRFLDGVWKAEFGREDWRSFEPQPTHYLHTAPAGEPMLSKPDVTLAVPSHNPYGQGG